MTSSEGKEDLVQADASTTEAPEKVTVRSEWRPIESAPKDGTYILIWVPGYFEPNEWRPSIARWSESVGAWDAVDIGMIEEGKAWDIDGVDGPCAWHPLPLAPDSSLNFSNESVSDAVSLNQSTSLSHPGDSKRDD